MNRNSHIDFLKGIAIIMVVLMHAMSGSSLSYDSSISGILYRTILQLLRPAVPIFVAVSGFLLAASYSRKPLSYWTFIKKRLVTLLPLYILWLIIIGVIFWLYKPWSWGLYNVEWWRLVFLGRLEYHLYFVPMIIALYAIFPFLYRLLAARPKVVLFSSFLIQTILYLFISQNPSISWFHYDQHYYLLPLSWIFYFVLGMYVNQYPANKIVSYGGLACLFVGLALTIYEGEVLIKNGANIVPATLTTRLTVMLYASGLLAYSLKIVEVTNKSAWYWLVVKIGEWSYLIFMIHTIFLRFLQEFFNSSTAWLLLQAPIIAYLVGVALSLKVARRRAQ